MEEILDSRWTERYSGKFVSEVCGKETVGKKQHKIELWSYLLNSLVL